MSPAESFAAQVDGTELARCRIDLPSDGYVVPIDQRGACPNLERTWGPNTPSLRFNPAADQLQADGQAKLAVVDEPPASYESCKQNTRYTNGVIGPSGTTVCVYGQNVIGAVTVVEIGKNSGRYMTLDLVVWRATSK